VVLEPLRIVLVVRDRFLVLAERLAEQAALYRASAVFVPFLNLVATISYAFAARS